ncbi:unnamed protein product [Amaranthus hypochondriacus]
MEMEEQYTISDLRHFISIPTTLSHLQPPLLPPPSSDLFSSTHYNHRGILPSAVETTHQQPQNGYETMVLARNMGLGVDHHMLLHNSTKITSTNNIIDNVVPNSSGSHSHTHTHCGDGGVVRWPRQETLSLLEVRSKLDHKFKEANQKAPLWDEVARVMLEEHGYQRTGKKCREKFENLYKYYKKTKEGKAGRQDGKHYRFFKQLDALFGENHPLNNSENTHQISEIIPSFNKNPTIPTNLGTFENNPLNCPPSVSLSNSSNYDTSSLDDIIREKKKKRGKGNWKAKIKEFLDYQMRKIMEKQEDWVEKMMKIMENREKERIEREEQWRKQEIERMEKEYKFWANERAWIEARDLVIKSALEKISNDHDHDHDENQWLESEVTRLIQLRSSMESRFQQCGFLEDVLWEDIGAKMSFFGYDKSGIVCKEKWDSIIINNNYFQEKDNNLIIRDINYEVKKKRKENYGEVSNTNNDYNNNNSDHNEGCGGIRELYMNNHLGSLSTNCEFNNNNNPRLQLNEGSSSPSSHNSNVNQKIMGWHSG